MRKYIFILVAALAIGLSAPAHAQLLDLKSIYSLTSDTVTNTATVTLSSIKTTPGRATSTTVWVAVTKISGTVGGTITLMGSLDGTNYKAINTSDTQTALATVTATDATNTYHWRLAGSPFQYYRVSWTGTGTMSASFTAKVLAR